MNKSIVLIRGAGELASAVGVVLHRVGFSVILTELPIPLAIRRTVCFSDAMLNGTAEVEGIKAVNYTNPYEGFEPSQGYFDYNEIIKDGKIPVLVDSIEIIKNIKIGRAHV